MQLQAIYQNQNEYTGHYKVFVGKGNNSVMDEIEACIEQNLAGGAVALNSFNTNMLLTLKEAASEAESDQELEEIRERLHSLTDCKPNNQGFLP